MEAKLNTKQQTVYLTIGLPASGKTTYAHAMVALGKKIGLSVVRVNNDDIRDELFGPGFDWSPALEKKVRATRMARLDQAIRDGHYVVVDNTHINPKTLNSMKEWLKQTHPKVAVEEVDFRDVPVHVCIDRDRERQARGDRFVGAGVILKMAQEGGLNDDTPPKPIDWLLPFAIVCDLDGTLALFGNKRNPYDASQCDIIDEPNFPVLSTLRVYLDMMSEGNPLRVSKIFFFSGRTDKYEAATKRFLLNKCGFDVDDDPRLSLTMRRDGDFTGDEIIKEQMYRDHIEGKYNVLFIFDDRPKVVRMWHRLGLPVFNVGSGREF
jgi:predicted kinase